MFARKSIFSAGRACLRKRMQAAAARNGGIQGPVFSAGASNQISLMKWECGIKPIGSEKKGIRALFS